MSLEHSPARQRGRRGIALFEPDQLYSATQIRDKLGGKTHVVTVWRWAKLGRLGPRVRVGPNTVRFLGSELNQNLFPTAD